MFMILFNLDKPEEAYTFGPFDTKGEALEYAKNMYWGSKILWTIYPHIHNSDKD